MTKLTKAQVSEIKTLLADDELTQADIAKKFNVKRSIISNIATGRAHKDVPGPTAPHKTGKGQRKKLPEHDPTDARVLDLEGEVAHLQDERNHARRQVKAGA